MHKLEELNRSNEELEHFAYIASHDLQEPLRMVSSYTQLSSRRYKGQLDADADEFIAFAVDGASRMQRLIQDLLAFSRVGTKGEDLLETSSEDGVARSPDESARPIDESGAIVTHDPLPHGHGRRDAVDPALSEPRRQRHQVPQPGRPGGARLRRARTTRRNGFSRDRQRAGDRSQYFDRIFGMFQRLHGRDESPAPASVWRSARRWSSVSAARSGSSRSSERVDLPLHARAAERA